MADPSMASRTGPRRARDERAAAALAAARDDGYGPGTPPAGQYPVMAFLQRQGCYLGEIGALFGVTRETVRRRIRRGRENRG